MGFVGNEGYLALLMALAAVEQSESRSLLRRMDSRRRLERAGAFLLALAPTRNVTGWIALLVGALPFARAPGEPS